MGRANPPQPPLSLPGPALAGAGLGACLAWAARLPPKKKKMAPEPRGSQETPTGRQWFLVVNE